MSESESETIESEIIEGDSQASNNDELDDEIPAEDQIVVEDEEDVEEIDYSKYEKIVVKIKPENRITSEILSKFERNALKSNRIKQINSGDAVYVDVNDLMDATSMAERELAAKRCPLNIQRSLGIKINKQKGVIYEFVEEWNPNEMIHKEID